jgi:hypothetical protein
MRTWLRMTSRRRLSLSTLPIRRSKRRTVCMRNRALADQLASRVLPVLKEKSDSGAIKLSKIINTHQ